MAPNESTELSAGITTGAENSDWNLIHGECIIMHHLRVNAGPTSTRWGIVIPAGVHAD
jgi:hypothetical protein